MCREALFQFRGVLRKNPSLTDHQALQRLLRMITEHTKLLWIRCKLYQPSRHKWSGFQVWFRNSYTIKLRQVTLCLISSNLTTGSWAHTPITTESTSLSVFSYLKIQLSQKTSFYLTSYLWSWHLSKYFGFYSNLKGLTLWREKGDVFSKFCTFHFLFQPHLHS